LQDTVLAEIAHTTAQAAQHVETFFTMLRTELAFYVGCLNLHQHLAEKNIPVCIPEIAGSPCAITFKDLRDASLTLLKTGSVVGNDLEAWATPLIVITGASQGGKSTFLRSIGLAQIMMQAGMFVTAQYFTADLRDGIFTHYRRREDKELNSGKFDEELRRISQIIDHVGRAPLFLFNESFAATNEREGSEVARQIIIALAEKGGHVVFVTHMYALAEAFEDNAAVRTCFLLAERDQGGRRSFRILPGKAQATSFGRDLYRQVFGDGAT
jgi:DNA mismatch repair ATPase MutS